MSIVNGVIRKNTLTGEIQGVFGSSGADTIVNTDGTSPQTGFVPVYNATEQAYVPTNPSSFVPTLSFGAFGSTPNASGGSYSAGVITLQPASALFPGGVTTGDQTFSGNKTYTGNVTAPTFVGSLTGHASLDIPLTQKGEANGVTPLGSDSRVPAIYLPSYVDDILEYPTLADFPAVGELDKIYIALDTNKTYRWSGSTYVEVSPSDVNSVFGRTGIISAQVGDYSAFYPQLSGSYSNPSWITSLAWSKITGVPSFITLSSLSATSPIFYNNTTGVISSQPASPSQDGYITTGIQNLSGLKLFNSGLIANGAIGASGKRADAQIELDNTFSGGHTLLSLHNNLADDEAAITYSGRLSNNDVVQTGAGFIRFVDGINTFDNYETVYGFHLPAYGKDNTPFLLYSNNSVRLLAGATSSLPWNTIPTANTVQIDGNVEAIGNVSANNILTDKVIIERQSGDSSIIGTADLALDGTTVFLNAFVSGDVISNIAGGKMVTYGLDNYNSDLSGSYTARTKIDKGYADANYLATGSAILNQFDTPQDAFFWISGAGSIGMGLEVGGDIHVSGTLNGTTANFTSLTDGLVKSTSGTLSNATSSDLPGGPYLPLTAGSGNPLSGPLNFLGSTAGTGSTRWIGSDGGVNNLFINVPASREIYLGQNNAVKYTLDASGNNTWTGSGTFGKAIAWGTGAYTAGISQIYNDASSGTLLISKTGTLTDFVLTNGIGQSVFEVPTGTKDIKAYGALIGTSATFTNGSDGLTIRGYTAGGGFGAIYSSNVTPDDFNYSFLASSSITTINAVTSVVIGVGGNSILTATASNFDLTQPLTGTSATFSGNVITGDILGNGGSYKITSIPVNSTNAGVKLQVLQANAYVDALNIDYLKNVTLAGTLTGTSATFSGGDFTVNGVDSDSKFTVYNNYAAGSTGFNITNNSGTNVITANGNSGAFGAVTGTFTDGTQGLIIRSYTAGAGSGAIYPSTVTPSSSNYALAVNNTDMSLNAISGNITNAIGGSVKTTLTSSLLTLAVPLTGTSATFTGSVNLSKDGSNTAAAGPYYLLQNAAVTRQWFHQLNASNNIDWWYYNGSTTTVKQTLNNDGGMTLTGALTGTSATFSGNISAANFASGQYATTYTLGTNVSSITGSVGHYQRIGNEVHISGSGTISATAVGQAIFTLDPFIVSDFSGGTDAMGTGTVHFNVNNSGLSIQANPTTNKIEFTYYALATGNQAFNYSLMYTIE